MSEADLHAIGIDWRVVQEGVFALAEKCRAEGVPAARVGVPSPPHPLCVRQAPAAARRMRALLLPPILHAHFSRDLPQLQRLSQPHSLRR